MIRLNLSGKKRTILVDFHQHHIHPTIRQRAHVLLLRSENLSNNQISNITKLSEPSIINYVHQYLTKGASWITALNFRKPVSQLQSFDSKILAFFEKILYQQLLRPVMRYQNSLESL